MPQELKEAHRLNDEAVFAAYGLAPNPSVQEIFSELKSRYDAAEANYKPERMRNPRPPATGRRRK